MKRINPRDIPYFQSDDNRKLSQKPDAVTQFLGWMIAVVTIGGAVIMVMAP